MVFFAKPAAAKQSGQKGFGRTSETKKTGTAGASKRHLLAKEGHDNTAILRRALEPVGGYRPGAGAIPAYNPLKQLRAHVSSEGEETVDGSGWQHGAQPAAHVPLHMQSSLSEMLGGAWAAEEPRRLQAQPAEPSTLLASQEQQAAAESNFMQRNSQRLGGQGVASLLSDASTASQQACCKPACFMSALGDLKAGLTDDQKRKAAMQREQLKRDLEEQMRAKKEAEARRKQQLEEQEAREEAALQAYYVRQQAREGAEEAGESSPGAGSQPTRRIAGGGTAAVKHGLHARSGPGSSPAAVEVMGPREKPSRAKLGDSPVPPAHEQQYAPAAAPFLPTAVPPPAALLPFQQMPAPTQLAAAYSPYVHPLMLGQMQVPGLNPYVVPSLVPAAPPPAACEGGAASTQLTNLLKELQSEQRALAAQFAAQSDTVAKLQSDILSARRERDAAKQQLERVQHLLATNTAAAVQDAMARGPCASPSLDLDALAITTVLPASAALIPTQLPAPAVSQSHLPAQQLQAHHAGKPSAWPAPRLRAGSSTTAPSAAKPQKMVTGAPSSRKAGTSGPGLGTVTRAKAAKPGGRGWS